MHIIRLKQPIALSWDVDITGRLFITDLKQWNEIFRHVINRIQFLNKIYPLLKISIFVSC